MPKILVWPPPCPLAKSFYRHVLDSEIQCWKIDDVLSEKDKVERKAVNSNPEYVVRGDILEECPCQSRRDIHANETKPDSIQLGKVLDSGFILSFQIPRFLCPWVEELCDCVVAGNTATTNAVEVWRVPFQQASVLKTITEESPRRHQPDQNCSKDRASVENDRSKKPDVSLARSLLTGVCV